MTTRSDNPYGRILDLATENVLLQSENKQLRVALIRARAFLRFRFSVFSNSALMQCIDAALGDMEEEVTGE